MVLQTQTGEVLPLETAEEFLWALQRVSPPAGHRAGQFAFNLLLGYRPALAEEIRGTVLDPYHRNEVHGEFVEFVKARWT